MNDHLTYHDIRLARTAAAEWHGGQWSALYAFASCGYIDRQRLRAEARDITDAADRAAILRYLAHHLGSGAWFKGADDRSWQETYPLLTSEERERAYL
jgi:hypothetical protein